jgi:hypothetical protein
MKFMLIMNTPRDGYTQYMKWPKETLQANSAFMAAFAQQLKRSGELVDTAGLASPERAVRVRAGQRGKPITDGVFPESKEFLAGYWIIDVVTRERAVEIAAELSSAPGGRVTTGDDAPLEHFWIELRELLGSRADL